MTSGRATSKGQVTIPSQVRTTFGLRPSSRVSFVPTESTGYDILSPAGSVSTLEGAVTPPARTVSIEDMNEAVAAEAASKTR